MKEGLIKNKYELVIKEFQTILSASYVVMVAIGMLFNYYKYSEFGINIFQYYDVLDFLIAPFVDYSILIFTIISVLLPFLFYKLDIFIKNKFPKFYSKSNLGFDKKEWFKYLRIIVFCGLSFFYFSLTAKLYGKITKKQTLKQPEIAITYADNEIINGIVIGKTKEVIFLYSDEKVKAVALTSQVKEYEIK